MSYNPFFDFQFRIYYLLYSIAGFLIVVYAQWYGKMDWTETISASSVLILCSITASWGAAQSFQYYLPQRYKYGWVVLVGIIAAAFTLGSAHEVVNRTLHPSLSWLTYMEDIRVWFIGYVTVSQLLVCIVIVGWIRKQEEAQQEARVLEAEKLNREAELFLLHQQLQPHFMFNSLNSISALVGSRPEEAREMLAELSSFLRGTIKRDITPLVLFSEELNLMSHYLAIEKIRFSHRLNINLDVSDAAKNAQVPPMILQPVVENAVKFGLQSNFKTITISIKAFIANQELIIIVQNPTDQSVLTKGTGFGLAGIQRRLYLLYRQTQLLEAGPQGDLFETKIAIPQIQA